MPAQVERIQTGQGNAYVIDSALDEETLRWIDTFRLSLTLDSKRPTVDRRFFADGPIQESKGGPAPPYLLSLDPNRPMANVLEVAIQQAMISSTDQAKFGGCHVFRYQRFVEYTLVGSKLDPHTDGTKICDDTKKTSTHTLLLYLTDCEVGGETVLLKECTKDLHPPLVDGSEGRDKDNAVVIYATQPRRGRILLFPHAAPHAGAMVKSVPKICLRAEISLLGT